LVFIVDICNLGSVAISCIKGFRASNNLFILKELKLGNEQGRAISDPALFVQFNIFYFLKNFFRPNPAREIKSLSRSNIVAGSGTG
jgi:hypothetical protein